MTTKLPKGVYGFLAGTFFAVCGQIMSLASYTPMEFILVASLPWVIITLYLITHTKGVQLLHGLLTFPIVSAAVLIFGEANQILVLLSSMVLMLLQWVAIILYRKESEEFQQYLVSLQSTTDKENNQDAGNTPWLLFAVVLSLSVLLVIVGSQFKGYGFLTLLIVSPAAF